MEELQLFLSRQQSETLKKVDQALKDVEYYRQVNHLSCVDFLWYCYLVCRIHVFIWIHIHIRSQFCLSLMVSSGF